MFNKSIKSILIAGVIALGAVTGMSASANAGGKLSVYIGNGHGGGIHYGESARHGNVHYRGGNRRHGDFHRGHRRAKCGPRRALNKAYRYGLNRPFIQRINERRVVVKGWNRGHPARIVFSRKGRGCQIIKTRGI